MSMQVAAAAAGGEIGEPVESTVAGFTFGRRIDRPLRCRARRRIARPAACARSSRLRHSAASTISIPSPCFRALWRRELVGSTALGCGIAIPHARIDGIKAPTTLYLRAKWPIDFAAPDGKPVRHLLVIMVPTDGDTDAHLQLLAAVAQGLTERALRDRLTAANDEGAIRRAFAEALPAAGDAAAGAKLVGVGSAAGLERPHAGVGAEQDDVGAARGEEADGDHADDRRGSWLRARPDP